MKLSIIIVSFNTASVLKKCLLSLPKGTRGIRSWETVVIDNGSTDGSPEMLRELKKDRPDLNLNLIENEHNVGFSRAVNQAMALGTGEAFLWLNSDILCRPSSITKLANYLKIYPETGLIGGRLLDPAGTPQASAFRFPTLKGSFAEFWLGKKHSFSKYLPLGPRPVKVEALAGAVCLVPRRVIDQVGDLEEKFFMYFEDLDFCRRLKEKNLSVVYLPRAEFFHYHGLSGRSNPEKTKSYLKESSKLYFGFWRHYLLNLILWSGQKWQKLF